MKFTNRLSAYLLLASIAFLLTPSNAFADDWPHWHGPARNDISSDHSGWNGKEWPVQEKWKTSLGVGSGSPIVVGKQVYALGWRDGKDIVSCLDLETGKVQWQQSYACPQYGRDAVGDQSLYRGPSTTPEYDSATGYLYTLSCDGDLMCWDTKKNGDKIWGFNLHDRYQIKQRPKVGRRGLRDYGYTTAPLVWNDWLIVEVGCKNANTIAFNKKNGKEVWQSELKEPAGHAGGLVPMTVENIPCLAVFTIRNLAVIRLDEKNAGKTMATFPWITDFANSIATPAVEKNYVVITSAYNHGTICKLEITTKGAKQIWESRFASGVCSPIIHKNHLYWAWNQIRCLDFTSGDSVWSGGRIGAAGSCIITSDDKMIVWCGRGQLMLIDTVKDSPNSLNVLAEKKLLNDTAWPHVVLANGWILCKDRSGNMVGLSIQKK